MNVDQFVTKAFKAADGVSVAAARGAQAGGRLVQKATMATLAAETGGSLTLRGVKGHKKMAVVATPLSVDSVLVKGIPGGLWGWLESGTKKHIVGGGRGAQSVGRNAHGVIFTANKKGTQSYATKLMSFGAGNGVAYGPFLAGGSPAKHPFAKGVEAARPQIPVVVQKETRAAMLKAFR